MKELIVIYRACGKELAPEIFKPERPKWFDKKKCWNTFCNSFLNKAEIHVVWDGDIDNRLFEIIKVKEPLIIIHKINEESNQKSLEFCYNLAEKLDYKFVYFAEDDYEWSVRSYEFVLDALKLNYDPLTIYNHPDRYIFRPKIGNFGSINQNVGWYIGGTDITLGKDLIGQTNYGYIRTCESTTGSFACSKDFFEFVKEDLYYYNNIGFGAVEDRKFWRNLYQKHNIRLWSALPGLSFHMSLPLPFEWEIKNEN